MLTATALALGFLHGLGADHLMAIAALAVHGERGPRASAAQRPFGVALRFAMGHALLLLVGAGAVLVLGWQIPEIVERGGERVGGVVLVGMGLFTLWVVASERLYGHSHAHGHHVHHEAAHVHWHFHFGRREAHPAPQAHSHGAGVLGAVFAVSGLRALTLLAPTLHGQGAASLTMLFYLVVVFALGILLSMSLFGIVLARVLGIPWVVRSLGRGAAALTALGSIGLGMYWIVS